MNRPHRPPKLYVMGFFVLLLTGCSGLQESVHPAVVSRTEGASAALQVLPENATVSPGNSVLASVMFKGTPGSTTPINVEANGVPGVSVVPSNFWLSPGATQTVSVTELSSSPTNVATIEFREVNSTSSSSALLKIMIARPSRPTRGRGSESPAPWPLRTKFVRTDGSTVYSNYTNRYWTAYDPLTAEFFSVDPATNEVFVLDAVTQKLIKTIPVPGAFSVDTSPDGKTIYVGTQIGDLYLIDTAQLAVSRRYISSQIGLQGFQAYIAVSLADGRLALLGGQGGIPGVDGYADFAIWNPNDNSLALYATQYGNLGLSLFGTTVICGPMMGNILGFARSSDRTKIVISSAFTDNTVCTFDVSTGAVNYVSGRGSVTNFSISPDNSKLVTLSGTAAYVYDLNTLNLLRTIDFPASQTSTTTSAFAPDSSTLYVLGGSYVYVYNADTGAPVGWTPNFFITWIQGGYSLGVPVTGPTFFATDGTGVFAGPVTEGVAFVDTSRILTGPIGTGFANAFVSPNTGPSYGGTTIQYPLPSTLNPTVLVYLGNNRASSISSGGSNLNVTVPPGTPGPADLYSLTADGGMLIAPEAYSYGPTVLQVTTNAATTDGGTGSLYGYGFGPMTSAIIPAGLRITIGGKDAAILNFNPNAYGITSQPFPLQAVSFTIPPGNVGTSNLVLTTPSGSTTMANAIQYLPAIQRFPLPGAVLTQGVYDPVRQLYYFADASLIRVFWPRKATWATPFAIPAPLGTKQRLWGLALSPDGSKLAVSDSGANVIYLLNPGDPSHVQTFTIPQTTFDTVLHPGGLAINDQGLIYYTVNEYGITGNFGYFKLDTNSGVFTDFHIDAPDQSDEYLRVQMSADGARVYFNGDGQVFSVDTLTNQVNNVVIDPACCYGDDELTLSSNNTQLSATDYFYDADLNPESQTGYNFRESSDAQPIYGAKLSPDGALLFQPLSNGIDVVDARLGILRSRISFPIPLSEIFDALVEDGQDNVLVGILGAAGDQGIGIIDLTSLPVPSSPHYVRAAAHRDRQPALSVAKPRIDGIQRNQAAKKQLNYMTHHNPPHLTRSID